MLVSEFIYACTDRVDAPTLRRMARRVPQFRTVLTHILHERIGYWSPTERLKVDILMRDIEDSAFNQSITRLRTDKVRVEYRVSSRTRIR